ncbi:unnamed protein product [Schistocephalus solidus]|uniref:Amino acid transporter n=1 Tax=Schistocephalus solidus TaxID=70667 RepID=A0A183T008_SCHSO|nr:unnamed protein product [Schistocephalus solidus]
MSELDYSEEVMPKCQSSLALSGAVPLPPKKKNFFLKNWFMITTILGVIIGFGAGFGIQKVGLDNVGKTWLAMPGTIYIRILQLTILPMISANVINGRGGDFGSSPPAGDTTGDKGGQISYIFRDLFLNIFPDNIVGVTLFQASTDFQNPGSNDKNETIYNSVTLNGTNMIGVLFVSFVFGLATNASKEKGNPFKNFFNSLGDVVMLLMQKFLLFTPVGVCFMVMSSIAEVEDLTPTFASLGLFVLLNFVGQITHFLLLLLSVAVLRVNPFRILRLCLPPYFLAFATTSSFVALPKCFAACDTYGIPKGISRFVLPLAGTMKSDAAAIFITGSCFFIAQLQNVALDAGKVFIIVILTTTYVTALPKIPSASVVACITILNSIGVDSTSASLLFTVEWLNDRLRAGNVALSHMYCTAFTYHVCAKDIETMERRQEDIEEDRTENDQRNTTGTKKGQQEFEYP